MIWRVLMKNYSIKISKYFLFFVMFMSGISVFPSNNIPVRISINGQIIQFNEPINMERNNIIIAPIRPIAERIGAEWRWNENTQNASIIYGNNGAAVAIGNTSLTVGNRNTGFSEYYQLPVTPQISNGVIVGPIEVIFRSLGLNVQRDIVTGILHINTPNYIPPVITISSNPVPLINVTSGDINEILSVSARTTQSAPIDYQWFSNTLNSNTGGTVINGATRESFSIPTTLRAGTYYYYCMIITNGTISIPSGVATVIVTSTQSHMPYRHEKNDWEISAYLSFNGEDDTLLAGSIGFFNSLLSYTFWGIEAKMGSRTEVVELEDTNNNGTFMEKQENKSFYASISPVLGLVYSFDRETKMFADAILEFGTLGIAPGFGVVFTYAYGTLKYRGMFYNDIYCHSILAGLSIPYNFRKK